MKIFWILLGQLLVATIATAQPTDDLWPLNPGNVWTYENQDYPERLTTITLQEEQGELVAIFEKTHIETYHSMGANVTNYWYLLEDEYGLRATHNNRYDRDTGELVDAWGYYGKNAYIIFPWDLQLPHNEREMQSYHREDLWQWAMGDWRVSYSSDYVVTPYYTGEVVKVAFLEDIVDPTGHVGLVKENWYFADGVGPVMIEQWNFPEPTYVQVRIVLTDRQGVEIETDPRMALDLPQPGATIPTPSVAIPYLMGGWAIDLGAPSGTGVDAVAVWAIPQGGGANIFLGYASLGLERPGIGALYGPRFTFSGYGLWVTGGLPAGNYTLVVFARSTVTGTYNNSRAVAITVSP